MGQLKHEAGELAYVPAGHVVEEKAQLLAFATLKESCAIKVRGVPVVGEW